MAASAGIDSTVLAHGLSLLPERCDVGVAIGHVNHGLRAGESDGDEAAVAELASALKDKRIWAAGLDVFEHEPRVHPHLTGLDNVVMTPHFGSAERHYREQMTAMACANVAAVLKGKEPPNRVV